jgi:Fic family protein
MGKIHFLLKEVCMHRRRGKSISFDAMVKFFMQAYDIPTKRDVEKIMSRLDQLERAIASAASSGRSRNVRRRSGAPAAETVFDAIKRSRNGLKFADIQTKTGFAEKKIRNIIFRLNKLGKIKRHSRGVYVAQ